MDSLDAGRVLSDDRFLNSRAGFSAQDLLERLKSPRLDDMPRLGSWIDAAADAAGVSRELMCVVPQKEQSALTSGVLDDWARMAFCGYDVQWAGKKPAEKHRGPKRQLLAAAKVLRLHFDRADEIVTDWHARVGEPFAPAGRTIVVPANRATAALYTYTPGAPGQHDDKQSIRRIWEQFGLGNPLAKEAVVVSTPTPGDVVEIAKAVCEASRNGQNSTTKHGVKFNLKERGYCLRFVRQCYAAAVRRHVPNASQFDYDAFPWLARYASTACKTLHEGGHGTYGPFGLTDDPEPGDIIGISPNYTKPGHIGIFLGRGLFAENTSSTVRGPGTVISEIEAVAHRITGYYRVLPSVRPPHVVVLGLDGEPLEAGAYVDNNRVVCPIRDLAEALGFRVGYRVLDNGQREVTILKPE